MRRSMSQTRSFGGLVLMVVAIILGSYFTLAAVRGDDGAAN